MSNYLNPLTEAVFFSASCVVTHSVVCTLFYTTFSYRTGWDFVRTATSCAFLVCIFLPFWLLFFISSVWHLCLCCSCCRHQNPKSEMLKQLTHIHCNKLVSWLVFEPSQPLGIISGLKEIFMKRYTVEKTNKAEIRLEEQSEKTESCQKNLWNEI